MPKLRWNTELIMQNVGDSFPLVIYSEDARGILLLWINLNLPYTLIIAATGYIKNGITQVKKMLQNSL